ncbi:hypothetical protein, partial [Xanthovirga aplysinae]|uniref:hypothetical protein n=1 Tax=Xanthovirga aplysinae TaxID=2529853 RepID=UPI0012BB60A6
MKKILLSLMALSASLQVSFAQGHDNNTQSALGIQLGQNMINMINLIDGNNNDFNNQLNFSYQIGLNNQLMTNNQIVGNSNLGNSQRAVVVQFGESNTILPIIIGPTGLNGIFGNNNNENLQ